MARPPLPLGQHGEISVAAKRGQWVARCRWRGFDGVTRKVERAGRTRTAARQTLQDELRRQRGERTEVLRPESRFRDAADIWMGKIRERREDSTAHTYASCLNNQVGRPLILHDPQVSPVKALALEFLAEHPAVELAGKKGG